MSGNRAKMICKPVFFTNDGTNDPFLISFFQNISIKLDRLNFRLSLSKVNERISEIHVY